MNNLKHDIFSRGVVISAPSQGAGRDRAGGNFCTVPLEQASLLTSSQSEKARRRFSPEVVVTSIGPVDYHEAPAFHDGSEPGFATHMDGAFMGFDAAMDGDKLLDKWCRIEM